MVARTRNCECKIKWVFVSFVVVDSGGASAQPGGVREHREDIL